MTWQVPSHPTALSRPDHAPLKCHRCHHSVPTLPFLFPSFIAAYGCA